MSYAQPTVKLHVFRALDESLFAADWKARPRQKVKEWAATDAGKATLQALNADVDAMAAEFDLLNLGLTAPGTPPTEAEIANLAGQKKANADDAFERYRGLSDTALRVLAALPGMEAAFTQVTAGPLDPEKQADEAGPDDPDGYVVKAERRAWRDTLDGRSPGRYLYRAAYLDKALNISGWSLPGWPVRVPDARVPATPVIVRVYAGHPGMRKKDEEKTAEEKANKGDRQITIEWVCGELGLDRWVLYRAGTREAAQSVVGMVVRGEVAAKGKTVGAVVSWTDTEIEAGCRWWYRVVAVRVAEPSGMGWENRSVPTPVLPAQAYELPATLTKVEEMPQ